MNNGKKEKKETNGGVVNMKGKDEDKIQKMEEELK